jgi:hypothetical protein
MSSCCLLWASLTRVTLSLSSPRSSRQFGEDSGADVWAELADASRRRRSPRASRDATSARRWSGERRRGSVVLSKAASAADAGVSASVGRTPGGSGSCCWWERARELVWNGTRASFVRGEPSASSTDVAGAPPGGEGLYLPSTQGADGMTARGFASRWVIGVAWPEREGGTEMRRAQEKVPRQHEADQRMAAGNPYLRGESPLPEGMGALRVARCVTERWLGTRRRAGRRQWGDRAIVAWTIRSTSGKGQRRRVSAPASEKGVRPRGSVACPSWPDSLSSCQRRPPVNRRRS